MTAAASVLEEFVRDYVETAGGVWDEVEPQWQQLAAEVLGGMKEWRLQHPQATLQEIEAALDARLSGLRARLGAAAAQDVRARFSTARLLEQTQGLYDELLKFAGNPR